MPCWWRAGILSASGFNSRVGPRLGMLTLFSPRRPKDPGGFPRQMSDQRRDDTGGQECPGIRRRLRSDVVVRAQRP